MRESTDLRRLQFGTLTVLLTAHAIALAMAWPASAPAATSAPRAAAVQIPDEDEGGTGAAAWLSSQASPGGILRPQSSPIFSVNDSFLLAEHTFDRPSGACMPNGWTGQDRTGLIFAQVSTRFVQNSVSLVDGTTMNMGTRGIWVGADMTTHPDEVKDWVLPYGYGNGWSQRIVSPSFTPGAQTRLLFLARLDLQVTPGLTIPTLGTEFFVVQAQRTDGSWASLTTRCTPNTGSSTSFSAVIANLAFRGEVRLWEDGNQLQGVDPSNTKFRFVLNTNANISAEDGRRALGEGALVLDSLVVQDAATSTDLVAVADFEDGTTGGWTFEALNVGVNTLVPPPYVRDVPLPNSQPGLASGMDFNDPTCLWSFPSATGFVEPGMWVRMASPWLPMYQSDSGFVATLAFKMAGISQSRLLFFRVRGKNVGDARPRFHSVTNFIILGSDGEPGAEPLFQSSWRFPSGGFFGFPAGVTGFADSVQILLDFADHAERFLGVAGLLSRSPSTLPYMDDFRFYLINADADHDGVADAVDADPTASAAGQDADGDGRIDAGATMRHVESWSSNRPLRYAISANADPLITDGSDVDAIHQGFASWVGVAGSSLDIQVDPPTSQTTSSPFDGVNLITFEDDSFAFPPNVVAVTPTLSFLRRGSYLDEPALPGQIVDSDMIFNRTARFSTETVSGGAGSFDLESVVAHEAGHFLGIGHSGVLDATMFFVLQAGTDAASLEEDDHAAIAGAYPSAALDTDFGTISGWVVRGGTLAPLPGALVTAVRLDALLEPQDSVASDYTAEDGSYALRRLAPGNYAVRVTPLNGDIGGYPLTAAYISQRLSAVAESNFDAEWWDSPDTESDDPDRFTPISVSPGPASSFTYIITNIDVTPPGVASTFPTDGASQVRIDSAILVDFSERIDAATLSNGFRLHIAGAGNPKLGGNGVLLNAGRRFVFTPSPPLEFNTTYELELTSAITDVQGVPLAAPVVVTFATETRPTVAITDLQPRSGSTGSLITVLGVGFSTDPGEPNEVSFTFCPTCPAAPVTATNPTPTSLVVRVPDGAITGPIQVTAGVETSNEFQFTVFAPGPQIAPSLTDLFDLPAGFSPTDVAIAPDGLTLYAAGLGGLATVNLDPSRANFRVPVIEDIGSARHLALSPDGARAYVTRRDLGNVVLVDADPTSGTFRQIRATIPTGEGGSPDGIAMTSSGRRAFVTDELAGVLYEIDTDPTSSTRDQVVREISDPDASLTGGVAVLPGTNEVLYSTSNIGSRRFDISLETASVLNNLPSGGGAAANPSGGEALFVGAGASSGSLLYTRLDSPTPQPGSLSLGGDLRDVVVNPQGRSAFVVNAAYNQLQVVDVDPFSPSYHTAVAEVATQSHPVAVSVSAAGDLIAVANEGSSSLSLYGTGSSGQIVRVFPSVASPGDAVSISFTPGFDATGAQVDLGAGPLPAIRVSAPTPIATAFRVSSQRQDDVPLTVVEADDERTLAIPFRIVDPIPGFSPQPTVGTLGPDLFTCMGSPTAGVPRILRGSHGGQMLAVVRESACDPIVDLYRVSDEPGAAFGDRLASIPLPGGTPAVADLAFTPDDRKLWVAYGTAQLLELDVDPASPTFTSVTPFATVPAEVPRAILADPMGRFMVVALATGVVTFWNPDTRGVLTSIPAGGEIVSLTASPDGAYALAGSVGRALILDLDARSVATSTPSHGGIPADAVSSIAVTADGRRAVGKFDNGNIAVWNLDSAFGAVGTELYYGNPLPGGAALSQLLPAPDGDGVLAGSSVGSSLFKLEPSLLPPTVTDVAVGQTSISIARSLDGRLLWAGDASTGAVRLFNMSEATEIFLVSGSDQSGLPGTTLPIPVRARVTDGFGRPQVGVVLNFQIYTGDGSLDGLGATVLRTTDTNGEAQVSWTLGSTAGTDLVTVTPLGVGTSPLSVSAEVVGDDTQIEPVAVAFGPADGSTGINIGSAIYVRFNQHMDEASVRAGVALSAGGVPVAGQFAFEDDGRFVVFRPTYNLPFDVNCQIVVAAGILDREGQATAAEQFTSFTVQSRPPLALTSLNPPAVEVRSPLVISGEGFSTVAAQNLVLFNGIVAPVTTATFNELRVNVPEGATTGPVTVTVGSVTSNSLLFTLPAPPPAGGIPVDDIQAAPGARDIEITPDGRHAYVTNPLNNTVTVMGLDPPALLGSITVGLQPQGIAILPEGDRAYVANTASGTLSVIDTKPGSSTYNRVIATIPVGPKPVDVGISVIGPEVIVVNADESGTVSFVDADPRNGTYHQVTARTNTGSTGQGVAVTGDGTRAFVLTAAGELLEIDLADGSETENRVVTRTNTGSTGQGVAVTGDGALVLVLLANGGLLAIDVTPGSATQNQVVTKTNTGSTGQGVGVSADGGSAFVSSGDDLYQVLIQLAGGGTNTSVVPGASVRLVVQPPIDVGGAPAGVLVDPFRERVYVVDQGAGKVVVVGPSPTQPVSPPLLTGVSPTSPGSSLTPSVQGTAAPGATVQIYTNSTCTPPAVATGLADESGAFGIAASVAPNSTTTFHASAALGSTTSECSAAGVSYVHDGIAPEAPVIATSVPVSPSTNASPTIHGTAEAGSAVTLYAQPDCSGAPLGTAVADGSGQFTIAVSVAENTTTSLFASATDAAGNVSSCSAEFAFTHDTVAPAAPAIATSTPSSPSTNTAPTLHGTSEPGTTVTLFLQSDCTGPSAGSGVADALGAYAIAVTVAPNSTTTFFASAVDAAGNGSVCSTPFAYTHDDTPPAAPIFTASVPASPASNPAPVLRGTAEAGALVTVYAQGVCTGPPAGSAVADALGDFQVPVSVAPLSTTTFHAAAQDAAGNVSACSDPLTYVHVHPVAEFNFEPFDFTTGTGGKWVTGYIELPAPYLPSQILVPTIRLNSVVPADTGTVLSDIDHDGLQELVVKFSRIEVEAILPIGEAVTVTVSGSMGSISFTGSDVIRVKRGKKKATSASALSEVAPQVPELVLLGENPARTAVTVRFSVPAPTGVIVEVFDPRGRRLRSLAQGARGAGWHEIEWNGRDELGNRVQSGVYYVRYLAAGSRRVAKVVWLR